MKELAFQPLDPSPRLRVIQFNGKRYALKLENVFWDILQEAATRSEARLNHLVGSLAGAHAGNNLTGALRNFATQWAMEQLGRERLRAKAVDAQTLADACPCPCFVVNERRELVLANEALMTLLGPAAVPLPTPLEHVFRLHFTTPAAQAWATLAGPAEAPTPGRLTCMLPGTRLARNFRACALGGEPMMAGFFLLPG